MVIILSAFTFHRSIPITKHDNQIGMIQITGLVNHPYNVTYSELHTMPSVNVSAALYCVDDPNVVRKYATWKGVPLRYLLEQAQPKNGSIKVVFYASDTYTTDLWLSDVMNDTEIIVAYKSNGIDITPRLIVPGRWGYKWIKGIVKIEVVNTNFLGTWESAGYPDDALINGSTGRRPMG
ncbi:molybdopterin-dependent oxidoreductase [Thermococcus sp.]